MIATVSIDQAEYDLREPLVRLSRDLKRAARQLTARDARWLTDQYYIMQDARIRAASQQRTQAEQAEPHELIGWVFDTQKRFEAVLQGALGEFAASYRVGQWMQAQCGIGPILSAACLANLDIRKAPTVGHIWRFCGLDPGMKWLGKERAKELVERVVGKSSNLSEAMAEEIHAQTNHHVANIQAAWVKGIKTQKGLVKGRIGLLKFLSRRPWNARLKAILVYRMGECFVKTQNNEASYYGRLYRIQKDALIMANDAGNFAAAAAEQLEEKKIGKQTECYKHLTAGHLPPAQIHARARRWAVKLFLSHLHHVMYWDYHEQDPPHPYIFERPENGDHRHLLCPPLWPGEYDGRRLKEMT